MKHPCYGSRRMQAVLSQGGPTVSRKRVQRLMRDMGIMAIYPGPRLSAGDESESICISMDGRGRCMDNIFTERFWRSYKQEEVYLKEYESPREARRSTAEYIRHYNFDRPHQSLNYRTP